MTDTEVRTITIKREGSDWVIVNPDPSPIGVKWFVRFAAQYKGTELVDRREAAGLTQADLVRITGMARRQVQRYERPHPVTVHEETFEKLMGAIKKPRG